MRLVETGKVVEQSFLVIGELRLVQDVALFTDGRRETEAFVQFGS